MECTTLSTRWQLSFDCTDTRGSARISLIRESSWTDDVTEVEVKYLVMAHDSQIIVLFWSSVRNGSHMDPEHVQYIRNNHVR